MRILILLLANLVVLLLYGQSPLRLTVIDSIAPVKLPHGISGIEQIDDTTYYLVSDVTFAIYKTKLDIKKKTLSITDSFSGKNVSGERSDFESIRIYSKEKLIISTEGKVSKLLWGTIGKGTLNLVELKLSQPERYNHLQENKGIEGMTVATNGNLWIVNEKPFVSTIENIDLKGRIILQRHVMNKDSLKLNQLKTPAYKRRDVEYPFKDIGDKGVSEILAWSDDSFLVMERSHDPKDCIVIKLFAIEGQKQTELITLPRPDNYEGMCYGPLLGGKKTLLIVSDDNEGKRDLKTRVLWLQFSE